MAPFGCSGGSFAGRNGAINSSTASFDTSDLAELPCNIQRERLSLRYTKSMSQYATASMLFKCIYLQ